MEEICCLKINFALQQPFLPLLRSLELLKFPSQTMFWFHELCYTYASWNYFVLKKWGCKFDIQKAIVFHALFWYVKEYHFFFQKIFCRFDIQISFVFHDNLIVFLLFMHYFGVWKKITSLSKSFFANLAIKGLLLLMHCFFMCKNITSFSKDFCRSDIQMSFVFHVLSLCVLKIAFFTDLTHNWVLFFCELCWYDLSIWFFFQRLCCNFYIYILG